MTYLFCFSRDEGTDFTFLDDIFASVPETLAFQALRSRGSRSCSPTCARAPGLEAHEGPLSPSQGGQCRRLGPTGVDGNHHVQPSRKGVAQNAASKKINKPVKKKAKQHWRNMWPRSFLVRFFVRCWGGLTWVLWDSVWQVPWSAWWLLRSGPREHGVS